MNSATFFSHEKLKAYQRAIEFVAWLQPVLESLPASASVRSQLDRASTSIPLNLAEGNGKFSAKERGRFFQISNGSALESAACLDVATAKGFILAEQTIEGKKLLVEVVSMVMALLAKLGSRLQEEEPSYGGEEED